MLLFLLPERHPKIGLIYNIVDHIKKAGYLASACSLFAAYHSFE